MKQQGKIILGIFVLSTMAVAEIAEPVITYMNSSNGHATVAGRLASKPKSAVGISVRNGNLIYSTISDLEGRWGIVIRHTNVNVSVESWNLANSDDRSSTVNTKLLHLED